MTYTEADQRADRAFLVGVNYGRSVERVLINALADDEQILARVTAAIYGDGLDDAPAIAAKAISAFLEAIARPS